MSHTTRDDPPAAASRFRRVVLDPRTLAVALLAAAAASLAGSGKLGPAPGVVWLAALCGAAGYLWAGAAAGYANSGST